MLALFGLADVNPRSIKVATPRRVRAQLPPFVELTQVRDQLRTTLYHGLASQPAGDAILECRGRINTERLIEATQEARKEGLLTTREWQRVRKGLRQ